jgi:hypothetical protein
VNYRDPIKENLLLIVGVAGTIFMPKRGNISRDFQGLGYAFTFIYCAKFNLLTGNKVYK